MKYPVPMPESFDSYSYYEYPLTSEDRVTLGAQWLDEVAPGWECQIDLSTLDIDNFEVCVCGQLFEPNNKIIGDLDGYFNSTGYHAVLIANYGDESWFQEHGFVFGKDTETWIALIKNRFDTGTLSDA